MSKQQTGGFRDTIISLAGIFMLLAFSRYASQIVVPFLLALVQFGPGKSAVVIALYLTINMIIGNVFEPKIMGKRLGLSTLAVFISLVFWGWLYGPVGMLLSVPLTMVVQSAAMDNPRSRWFGILLWPALEEGNGK